MIFLLSIIIGSCFWLLSLFPDFTFLVLGFMIFCFVIWSVMMSVLYNSWAYSFHPDFVDDDDPFGHLGSAVTSMPVCLPDSHGQWIPLEALFLEKNWSGFLRWSSLKWVPDKVMRSKGSQLVFGHIAHWISIGINNIWQALNTVGREVWGIYNQRVPEVISIYTL